MPRVAVVVVSAVGGDAPRPPARPADPTPHPRHPLDERDQLGAVVAVPPRRPYPSEQELGEPLPAPGLLPLVKAAPAGHARAETELGRRCVHEMPVCNTNRIPCSAWRSGSRLRPG